jgi:small multidrug resistance pump
MPWILLFVAILLEVAGITSMKLSPASPNRCSRSPSRSSMCARRQAVMLALKTLDLSVTYAIWSGVGTALATMIGIAYFREPITVFRMTSIALVTIGVIGLSLAARQSN